MSLTVSSVCDVFRAELLKGRHNFDTDNIKCALYEDGGDISRLTTHYTNNNEVVTNGYAAGGVTIPCSVDLFNGTGRVVAQNVILEDFVERDLIGGLLYNSSISTNNAIAVVRIDRSVVRGEFELNFRREPLLVI